MPKAGTLDRVHLRCHRNLILTPRSCHHTPKSQKGRFRERPKERKPLLHQPTLLAPSLLRQPPTPIHPPQAICHKIPLLEILLPPKYQNTKYPTPKPFLPRTTMQNPRPISHEKPET
jgi:hypothetical protein